MYHSPHSAPPPLQKPAPPSNAVKGLLIITLAIIISLGAGICIGTVRSTNQQARILEEQQLLAQVLVSRYDGINRIEFWGCDTDIILDTTYWFSANGHAYALKKAGMPGEATERGLTHIDAGISPADQSAGRESLFTKDPETGISQRRTALDHSDVSMEGITVTVISCFA